MKPKINLDNPFVKFALEALLRQTEIALNTPQTVERAIIPIYAIPISKDHKTRKTKPEQFGSGVLLKIKNEYFILSSTHIFKYFDGFVLQTGISKGSLIERLSGDRFSSGTIEDPFSNYLDATAFHIQSEISKELKELALGIEDLDFGDDADTVRPIYLASGFRVKKSNVMGNQIYTKREAFPSVEVHEETYKLFDIDPIHQFVLAYDDNILVNRVWQKSPIPRGFSGGGIIKIDGSNVHNPLPNKINPKQKLTAIITEHYREKNNKPGILISTKIEIHIGLIRKFMPEVFE